MRETNLNDNMQFGKYNFENLLEIIMFPKIMRILIG